MATSRQRLFRVAAGSLLFAGLAWASPWDIDMIDSWNYKAYEWEMKPQPSGVIGREAGSFVRPQDAGHYQNGVVAGVTRGNSVETDALANPYKADEASLKTGERFFQVNCAPCHGVNGAGSGPVTKNDPANGVNRFLMPAPILSGKGGVAANRSDGYLYATIRNGGVGSVGASAEKSAGVAAIGAGMPSYGLLLTDYERWSVVSYIRTLPESTYTPPAPPALDADAVDAAASKEIPG